METKMIIEPIAQSMQGINLEGIENVLGLHHSDEPGSMTASSSRDSLNSKTRSHTPNGPTRPSSRPIVTPGTGTGPSTTTSTYNYFEHVDMDPSNGLYATFDFPSGLDTNDGDGGGGADMAQIFPPPDSPDPMQGDFDAFLAGLGSSAS
jgi:hypothetical protein